MWAWLWFAGVNGLVITSRVTSDLDLNGYIDAINFTFSAPVDDTTMDAAVRGFAFTIVGYFFDTNAGWFTGDNPDDAMGYVLVEEGVSFDTGNTPGVKYDSTIVPGLAPESDFVTTLDGARPIVVNVSIMFVTAYCTPLNILFTEQITQKGFEDAFILSTPNDTATLGHCQCGVGSTMVSLISDSNIPPTFHTPKVFTTQMNVFADSTILPWCGLYFFNITNYNSTGFMQDSAGNVLVGSFFADSGPFAVSATYPVYVVAAGSIDSDQDGYIDGYRVMFNIPMNDFTLGNVNLYLLDHFQPNPDSLTRIAETTCDGPIERTNDDQFWCITVAENTTSGFNTDLTGSWSITPSTVQATGWVANFNLLEGGSTYGAVQTGSGPLFDWAAPVLVQVDGYDSHSTGYIDIAVLTFTESVQKNTTTASDWLVQSLAGETILTQSPVPQSTAQLVFKLTLGMQTLNTRVPAVQYIPYKPTFTDLHGNPIERRTPLMFEVPVLQSARGQVGVPLLTLHFSYNASSVSMTNIIYVGANNITGIISDGRDIIATLSLPLTQNSVDTDSVYVRNTTAVPITVLTTTVYVNQNQSLTDVLPASIQSPISNIGVGCAWRGSINSLLIVNGKLSALDFGGVFHFFQTRVYNQV
jgi:hypothetical protein